MFLCIWPSPKENCTSLEFGEETRGSLVTKETNSKILKYLGDNVH